MLNNSVKRDINIYNEFNNIHSFYKSLTHKQNIFPGFKSCEYYLYTYSQIIYKWERLTRTVTHDN